MTTSLIDFETELNMSVSKSWIMEESVSNVFANISKLSKNKKKQVARENSLKLFNLFLSVYDDDKNYEYILDNLHIVLTLASERQNEIINLVKTILINTVNKFKSNNITAYLLFIKLLEFVDCNYKLETKKLAYVHLTELVDYCSNEVRVNLYHIIPKIAESFCDLQTDIIEFATSSLIKLCEIIKNVDIEPFIPRLIAVFKDNEESTEVIHSLAAVTFVQEVDQATLSIIVPVLLLGFNSKLDSTKRLSAVIIANMTKLVNNPVEVEQYLINLMPVLENASQNVSEPEARSICTKAYEQIKKLEGFIKNTPRPNMTEIYSNLDVYSKLDAQLKEPILSYVKNIIDILVKTNNYDRSNWSKHLNALDNVLIDDIYNTLDGGNREGKVEAVVAVEDTAELLCNCKFTLAYGSKILLHNTFLTLKRGYRYGLLGGNECGKSTLLRAISNEQVEGFPPSTELKTVFVEADILSELSHLSCIDYIFADERIRRYNVPREDVKKVMTDIGFTEKMCDDTVSTLSGGWRMKLALCRAMLQKADILLLDEPTNHLDVINVAWVENYLCSLKNVTSIIVSHNKNVLNNCCTHILHIDNYKLTSYKGNLSEFVKVEPKASSYFQMKSNSGFKYKFPQPGFLDGVKAAGTPLMKMEGVSFKYPTGLANVLNDVNVKVSMASRVACVGRNGQGKSTMIKLLTGEIEPTIGTIWKKNNVRFAYVAQHAFHHIENHLTKTATEYICWRYENGLDKETFEKDTFVLSDEEREKLKEPFEVSVPDDKGNFKKVKRVIERLTGERKVISKDVYEFEVKLESVPETIWLASSKLELIGYGKIIKQLNTKIEANNGLHKRNLTQKSVEEILSDFGLDPEYSSHTRMSALSSSQRLKVVLAAAVWQSPHIIILDEPTNYFDRESMIALAEGLKDFTGGFIVISHNDEFVQDICKEHWTLENGMLNVHGDAEWMKNALKTNIEVKIVDEIVDSYGNIIKVKVKKELTNKEKKAREKRILAKVKNNEQLDTDEEEDYYALTSAC
jgi:elongation factor 3